MKLTDLPNNHPSKIETITYTGVFLTPHSKELLSEAVPARLEYHYGDHVTLVYKPDPESLSDYPMGIHVKIHVTKEVYSHRAQAVGLRLECEGVEVFDSFEALHITISTAKGTPPSHSKSLLTGTNLQVGDDVQQKEEVKTVELEAPLVLDGVLGVMMGQWTEGYLDGGTLNNFSESMRAKVEAFRAAAEPGSILKFNPGELTGYERKLIHEYAEKNGLLSKSVGPKNNRQLSLLYPGKTEDVEEWTTVEPKKKIRSGRISKRIITNINEWKAVCEPQDTNMAKLPGEELKQSEEEISNLWMAYAGEI